MPLRRRQPKTRNITNLSDTALAFFLDEEPLPEHNEAELFVLQYDIYDHISKQTASTLWAQFKEDIVEAYIDDHPGERPSYWWKAAEPRRRLGGIGDPQCEHLASVASFHRGIPVGWITAWDVAYYNGRATNIHGNPIGTEFEEGHFAGVALDPDDPPVFESEAAYLRRHKLLTAAERKYLVKHPELLEPEVLSVPQACQAGMA